MQADYLIPARTLRAMLNFAADKKDNRVYLRGVRVNIKDGYYEFVATDGTVLGHSRESGAASNWKPLTIVIPRHVIERIAKGTKCPLSVTVSVPAEYTPDSADVECELEVDSARIKFTPITGYPEFTRVIPAAVPDEAPHVTFDPELLTKFIRFERERSGAKKCYVSWQPTEKTGPAVVNVASGMLEARNENFYGLIMPLRLKLEPAAVLPDWAPKRSLK